ncbi:hypothetical protein BY996DRAFT_4599267 [Phakopsora pachyrhizi]|uniref:DUF7872 domain-containing protein n=1 Tax=Phakopsora pachyrhizi TaxID=170000 RepID=A0AAV0B4Y3_PHAPC|nr:hypothetical protein BY996DRAFT_4599267 [Phakopsora pachyrhizi]CAH7677629.1 hypothetical protein PPACK8108_LOCUS12801 [Phakopsora pachyrhizi]
MGFEFKSPSIALEIFIGLIILVQLSCVSNSLLLPEDHTNTGSFPQQTNNNLSLSDARTSCIKKPLNKKLWNDLELDSYLQNYIGGKTLSLVAFSDGVNVTNFPCGIGQSCDAGEMCRSAPTPAWYILAATQNWNDLMNTIYKSIAFAIGTIQDLAPSMVADLTPSLSSLPIKIATIIGVIASSTGVVPGFLFPGNGVYYYLFVQGFLYTTVAEIGLYVNTIRPPPDVVSGYTSWTNFAWLLSSIQDHAQQLVANYTLSVLQGGISTDKGLYGVLKNGYFLESSSNPPETEIENEIERVTRLKLLSAILRSRNTYITRGSDKCIYSGPDGAFPSSKALSYCDKNGIMMNIVQAHGSKTVMKFFGGEKITAKYNFTVGYLTEAAWNCQQNQKQQNNDPQKNRTIPKDTYLECPFTLPVCDCAREDIKKARRRGTRTAKACFQAGVPIYAPKI